MKSNYRYFYCLRVHCTALCRKEKKKCTNFMIKFLDLSTTVIPKSTTRKIHVKYINIFEFFNPHNI